MALRFENVLLPVDKAATVTRHELAEEDSLHRFEARRSIAESDVPALNLFPAL